MIRVRVGAATTTAIGALFAVSSLITPADDTTQLEGFATGLAVAIAGALLYASVTWMENR